MTRLRALAIERIVALAACVLCYAQGAFAAGDVAAEFHSTVEPILQRYCSDCHADGVNKGGVSFDRFQDGEDLVRPELWAKALKNVRAGLMPPAKKAQPTAAEKANLERWIKQSVFRIDPANPDPGRVVVRRMNRVEYRNTIRELLGVDYETEKEFPADDSGHGFDNIGSVLTISPLLMEKYLDAAQETIGQAVPRTNRVPAEIVLEGNAFSRNEEKGAGSLSLSYYDANTVSNRFALAHAGEYEIGLNLVAAERYVDNQFDYNRCRLTLLLDGEEVFSREFTREGAKPFSFVLRRELSSGDHAIALQVQPLTSEKQIRSLTLKINSVVVRGPFAEDLFVAPVNYGRFFPKAVPENAGERRRYAGDILGAFATKAFRTAVDEATVERLVKLAETFYRQPRESFESGVSQAMVAILASPRFIFREERAVEGSSETYPLVDEYSLATRLSYFLWSSTPDERLLSLAREHRLRANLDKEVERLLASKKSEEFVRNFSGQWLQTRDIETIQINARAVRAREGGSRGGGGDLDFDLRKAMRSETEQYFSYVVHENRPVLELIDSDYTFLNEKLAAHYGLGELGVTGAALRKVTLPSRSARGGVLTHGGVLVVTSNPTRTSPVKRGLFILENVLGTPPPPPPPDIPALEEAAKEQDGRKPTLRETLEIHRKNAVCSSCHSRMDPLGLALENFNALGAYRTNELNQPIDAAGTLISGESFQTFGEVKRILVTREAPLFYRTFTEKLLTYALGRGLEYYDVQTVDSITDRLENSGGRFSAALMGVIESVPFQRMRARQEERSKLQANFKSEQ